MTISRAPWHRWARAASGVAISTAFVAATLSRVDLDRVAEVWPTVAIGLVLVAVILSFAEVGVRAFRWMTLLRPFTDASYRAALAYLSIGHLANAVLPARLGDVARAFLTGGRFGISRASVLGTIAVERVADASLLGLAATVAMVVGYTSMAPAAAVLAFVGAAALGLTGILAAILGREAVAATRIGELARHHAVRFAAGASALRGRSGVSRIGLFTVTSFVLSVVIMHLVLTALGLILPIWQSALVMAAVTLSTAIPAGPASLGTYEFVGITALGSMGFPAESSLLAIALVHAVVTLPPAVMGLLAMWGMGIRRLLPGREPRVQPAIPGRAS